MCINWEAVGAIGQWFGAVGTIAAVLMALNADKSSFKIKKTEIPSMYPNSPDMSGGKLRFLVINNRNYPVEIIEAGFTTRQGEKLKHYNYFGQQLPKAEKFQTFEIESMSINAYLKQQNYTGENLINFYIKDASDSIYKYSFGFDTKSKNIIHGKPHWWFYLKWCNWMNYLKRII